MKAFCSVAVLLSVLGACSQEKIGSVSSAPARTEPPSTGAQPGAGTLLAAEPPPPHAWFPGEIVLPPQYSMRRTGTIDSDMGEISGPQGFVVHFDIGYMAGTHMHERRKGECEWFLEHTISGQKAFTGMRRVEGSRRVTTTIMDQPLYSPANFWAVVRSEKDLASFFAIVSTYKPPKPPPPRRRD